MNKIRAISFTLLSCCYAGQAYAQTPINAPPAPEIKAVGERGPAPAAAGAVPNVDARREIIYRANLGRAEDIKLLIDQGGSPNQPTAEGVPILALAAARKDAEGVNVVQMLVQLGADINGRDRKGQTPLFYAAKNGNAEVVNYLLEHKIDASALDNAGNVARTVAFRNGFTDIMKTIDNYIAKHGISQAAPSPAITAAQNVSTGSDQVQLMPPLLPTEDVSSLQPLLPEKPSSTPKSENVLEQMKKNTPSKEDMKRIQAELSEANRQSLLLDKPDVKALPVKTTSKTLRAIGSGPAIEEMSPGDEVATAQRKEFEKIAYEVAYGTCAFQYWSFCSDVKQSTDLESEEMTVAIMSNHAKVEAMKDRLISQYKVKPETYNEIMDSAQQRIYNQLNDMPSNQYRHERNIGKMDDMMKRCGEIGRQWAVTSPGLHQKKKDNDSEDSDNKSIQNSSSQENPQSGRNQNRPKNQTQRKQK